MWVLGALKTLNEQLFGWPGGAKQLTLHAQQFSESNGKCLVLPNKMEPANVYVLARREFHRTNNNVFMLTHFDIQQIELNNNIFLDVSPDHLTVKKQYMYAHASITNQ